MFAIVRTGGKQYRVAAGDKIVVEKLAGEAGDTIDLTDVLLAGEGGDLKSTAGLTVGARIIAQAKADKVTVFKKRRRHNYRRKAGHRQQHTIIEIVSIGGKKAEKKAESKAAAEPVPSKVEKPAAPAKSESRAEKAADKPASSKIETADKPEPAAKASTKDAAPAKPAQSKVEGAAAEKAAPKAAAKPKK